MSFRKGVVCLKEKKILKSQCLRSFYANLMNSPVYKKSTLNFEYL